MVQLDAEALADGIVRLGQLAIKWVVHTSLSSFRVIGLAAEERGRQLVLISHVGARQDGEQCDELAVRIHLEPRGERVACRVHAAHPDGVRVVKTVVQGLPPGQLRAVGVEGGLTVGARHRPLEYPGALATPFVWLQPEQPLHAARFVARCISWPIARKAASGRLRPSGDLELVLYEEVHAPAQERAFEGSNWLLGYVPSLVEELTAHGDELGRRLGLSDARDRLEGARDLPRLFVRAHGRDFNGQIHLTYRGVAKALSALATRGDLHGGWLHLIGWDGPFMRDCPALKADPALGGEEGLLALVRAAHSLGMRVLLHLGPTVAAWHVVRSLGIEACQAQDLHGGVVPYPPHDWDGDGFCESGWVVMNPWFREWRELLLDRCQTLLRDYGIDGFYLADLCRYVPDRRGDFLAGLRAFVDELLALRERICLVGEGGADYTPWLTPVFEPRCRCHTAEYQLTIGRYGLQVGHSAVADCKNRAGVGQLFHAQYRPLKGIHHNIVPAMSLTRTALAQRLPEIDSTFRWARQWSALWEARRSAAPG